METGDALVDEQHRGLVRLFNELLSAEEQGDDARMPEVLARLSDYVVVHFTAEEALMCLNGYPPEAVEAHVAEHRALTGRTRELILAYRDGRLTTVVPLVDFLAAWLSEHIDGSDRRLVEHVRSIAATEREAPEAAS
jgi:hemerythrin